MTSRALLTLLPIAALTWLACGSEVVDPGNDGDGKGSGGEVDPACYDACVAKGVSAAECESYCGGSTKAGGKTSASGETSASGKTSGAGGAGGGSGAGGGAPIDPVVEKSCIECWYDATATGGACEKEAAACEESLACTQLQWCPLLCEKEDCLPECNDIIPDGVAPLTDLVRCAACAGGPCADACADSVMLAYCE